ncbi:hypothetical protein DL766_002168 [Monosporascus sp. MC13-8B]|nr:hypothetical protein DL763_004987 [Monosporascus cannonballus]RYP36119.1 hypothetical protein DL766_002168 [Monosporascus sp. MC13-8B]
MSVNSLPVEVILELVRHLDTCRDVNALLRVNRPLYLLLDDELCLKNIKQQNSSALIWAVQHGRDVTARRLLALGADPNAQPKASNCRRLSALHIAAREGHFCLVQTLLDYGANPRIEDQLTKTPFYEALYAGHERVARQLARQTQDFPLFLAIRDLALSPIHVAAQLHKYNSIRWLIEAGQDVNQTDFQGRTALHFALTSGLLAENTLRVAIALLDMGATFGCGPSCLPDEAATRAQRRGVTSSEPLVRALFQRISCRCGIEAITKFLEDRDTWRSYKALYNVGAVAKTRVALLGHAH